MNTITNTSSLDSSYEKYPKRVFEIILEKTHYKEDSNYFFDIEPNLYN